MKRLVVVLASGLLWLGLPVTDLVAQPSTCQGQAINDDRPTDNDDFLTGTSGIDIAALGSGNDQYFASDAGDVLCGNEGDDVLGGELGPDLLNGGVGDDIVAGLGGNDVLIAGDGADKVEGGNGDDTLRVGNADGIQDDLYDGAGSDTIIGNDEDIWHRCADGEPDDGSQFTGAVVPDTDCS